MKKKTMITMVVIVLMLVLSIVLFAACDNDANDSKDKKPGSETEASLHEFALENCTADKESAKAGEQVTFTADGGRSYGIGSHQISAYDHHAR